MRSVEPPSVFEVAASLQHAELVRAGLDSFVSDIEGSGELEALEDALREFNLFEALGTVNAEIRHSNLLAWLFDPIGSHGFGDVVVKRFLQRVLIQLGRNAALTAVDVDLMDFSDLEIRREWSDIDIFLLSPANKLAVVIENKIHAGESAGQLEKYKKRVTANFSSQIEETAWRYVFLYLTIEGDDPSDTDFQPVKYSQIVSLLESLLHNRGASVPSDVAVLLRHYTRMMRRHHMEDSDLIGLAKKIYKKHKSALDFIFENRPDNWSDVRDRILARLKAEPVILDLCTPTFIRFYPTSWNAWDKWLSQGVGWRSGGSNRLMLCELRPDTQRARARFQFVLGPGEGTIRDSVLEKFRELELFKQKSYPSWTTVVVKPWRELEIDGQSNIEENASRLLGDVQSFLSQESIKIEAALKLAFDS